MCGGRVGDTAPPALLSTDARGRRLHLGGRLLAAPLRLAIAGVFVWLINELGKLTSALLGNCC